MHPPLSPQELDMAELSILVLFRQHLDDLPVALESFSEREVEALTQAKQRLLARWDDQIKFKTNQLRKGR